MMKKYLLVLPLILMFFGLFSQETQFQEGQVFRTDEQGEISPLEAAQVYWSDLYASGFTNQDGAFKIDKGTDQRYLIISYVGMDSDTIDTKGNDFVKVILKEGHHLETVEVAYERKTTSVSLLKTQLVQEIGQGELLKAACCNLSESFTTNPSVDVSLTDAISGTKQIKMLGLEGPNVQYTVENIPAIRGFSSLYGLRFIPGAWIESIQMSKGTGSVINGYEGISGQINVEERKASSGDLLHLNAYYNRQSRSELNAVWRKQVSSNWSTAVFAHGSMRPEIWDVNDDGFTDQPKEKSYSLGHRWRFVGDNGWRSRIFVESSMIDQAAGQLIDKTENSWVMDNKVQRHGLWAKLGKANELLPWRSFGSQYKVEYFQQESQFGNRVYSNAQTSFYSNFIYQSIIGNTIHGIKMGVNFSHDDYDERLDAQSFDREESVVGAFGEYDYSPNDKIGLVLGARVDYHNIYKTFFTPRLHFRFSPKPETAFRISAGRSRRVANIFSDHIGLFASNRKFVIDSSYSSGVYGLPMTSAWNFGISIHQSLRLFQRDMSLTTEFYHTSFTESIIIDRDLDSRKVYFYEQPGDSYSNSFQFQTDYELLDALDIRIAYRYFDVQADYIDQARSAPLVAQHRFFVNLAYEWLEKWTFDYTLNWIGKQRLPETEDNPEEFRLEDHSPSYFLHNAQISYDISNRLNAYLGAENIFGYRQENAIISSENPSNEYFDASNVWAPINGAVLYIGLRYSISACESNDAN